jgi:hypothetical protein
MVLLEVSRTSAPPPGEFGRARAGGESERKKRQIESQKKIN